MNDAFYKIYQEIAALAKNNNQDAQRFLDTFQKVIKDPSNLMNYINEFVSELSEPSLDRARGVVEAMKNQGAELPNDDMLRALKLLK